jgi:hypothetical protein
MANRNFNPPRALEKELITIVGRVPIAADASVGTKIGRGFTVAKTATGQYTITLQDTYTQLIGIAFGMIGSGTLVVHPEVESEAVATSKTIVIKTVDTSGVDTDTAVAFNLCFTLHMRNSSVA